MSAQFQIQFQKGQRDKLGKYLDVTREFDVEMLTDSSSGNFSCENFCLGIAENDSKARNVAEISKSGFRLNLKNCADIFKIVFAVETQSGIMGEIKTHVLRISQDGKICLSVDLTGADFSSERAIISGEIYRKNLSDEWRIACVASGFNDGVSGLMKFYGLTELPEPPIKNPEGVVNLQKGEKLTIAINPKITNEIVINLSWNRGKKSLFKSAIDLDVGCLYELRTGSRGCIQALGRDLGSLDYPPYIALDGDDRSGGNRAGETLRINCLKLPEIKRALIYAFIYEGAANWQEVDGLVKLTCAESGDVVIPISDFDTKQRICALEMFERIDANTFSIENLTEFFDGQESMDKNYGWGLNWRHGRK